MPKTAEQSGPELAPTAPDAVLTYQQLAAASTAVAARLADAGIGRGDRVGIRLPSGTSGLYVAILGVLGAGAAYVPVDADDPDERAELAFGEAGVRAVLDSAADLIPGPDPAAPPPSECADDAWVIFTSGSTGTPKGVAVTHRSAAAFVDAEAALFLAKRPVGPGDRVLAGLSVAFDASCEEMWLAWRRGARLVPAPRSLVRSGLDLGPSPTPVSAEASSRPTRPAGKPWPTLGGSLPPTGRSAAATTNRMASRPPSPGP